MTGFHGQILHCITLTHIQPVLWLGYMDNFTLYNPGIYLYLCVRTHTDIYIHTYIHIVGIMDIHNVELWISIIRVSDANFEASKHDVTITLLSWSEKFAPKHYNYGYP